MTPRKIEGNIWEIFDNEEVETTGGETVSGPLQLRVHYYPELKLMSAQGPERKYELKGLNFEAAVRKKKED